MTFSKVAALTGRPGVGKTTALVKVVELVRRDGFKPAGFYTVETRELGVRTGFEIVDVATGERAVLASTKEFKGPRVGRYAVNVAGLESLAVGSVRRGLAEGDAVFVDEVGPMELLSKSFVETVRQVLRSGKPSLLTVHASARHPVVDEVKTCAGENLFFIDVGNRDRVPQAVYEVLRSWLKT